MGITLPPLIPFGTECFAKLKRWHRRDWDHPFEKIRVLGPAMGMSATSKGYYIQSLTSGKFMRSTVVVNPPELPPLLPQLPQLEAEDYSPSFMPEDEGEDHLQDDVEEPMEICPDDVVEKLHAHQGGAEVQVHVMDPKQPLVPTPGELHLADGSRPRRLRGKQHVDLLPPSVSKLLWTTTGGSGLESVVDHELYGDQQLQQPEIRRYLNHLQQLCLLQHNELCRLRREETQIGDYDMMGETLKDIDDEVQRLEGALRGLAKLEPTVKEQETLVTKTLTLDEVRRELEEWKEPIKSEYESLLKHKAIEPINREQYQELQRTHDIEVIPGKLVATIKPPFKRKARLVACGNQASKNEEAEVAAGGLCTVCTRSWGCATVDVKTAFLQAPRREEKGKLTLVTPPAITKEAQVCGQEWWLVKGALCRLVESPKDWAVYRDATCKTISWKGETGQHRRLAPTPEPHVWSIEEMEKTSNGEKWFVIGNMGVYVDDLLIVAPDNILEETLKALEERFTLATREWVTGEKTVTFCGYEISKTDQGYALGQEKYIRDLIDKHNIKQTAGVPCPKVEEGPEEPAENLTGPVLGGGQQLCRELMWLTTRTRPDVAYTVGVMSRLLHKRPGYVVEVGQQCLKYLCGSASKKLQYKGGGPIDVLEVMVDASFGPPHEGYRSVQGIMMTHGGNPIMWASTWQPFITQSTAEAELLAYNEAYQCGESTGALLEVLGYGGVRKHMQGDSKSGISQLTSDTGAWRTRHLRLRSAKLREVVQDPEEPWVVSHCSGLELGADGLTKPLQGQAFTRFLGLIGMSEEGEVAVSKVVGPSRTSSTTTSTSSNTALTGVGAPVMGVGALMDSEPLVLGGLAMVAVSMYRQRHGVPQEQEDLNLHHGRGLLPGDEHLAGASEPQLKVMTKKEEKSLKTTRLAKRPQKDHKGGQTPKGNLDEAAHPPRPQSRASTAEGSNENLCCNGSQSFFPGYGGVAHVPGWSSTDRARPCASNGVESSRPPKGALQEQSVHVTGGLQSVHEMPRVSALRYQGDPDDPIEDPDSEADPGVPFPHGDPHGNAYLRQLGNIPPAYKAPPVQWMQQHAPKAPLPKARPKRRAEEAQPKQRAEAFRQAVEVERGSIHQAVQREQQQQGASSSSSTGQQGYPQQQPQGALPREPTDNEVDGVLRRVAENWLFTQPPWVQDGWHYMDVVELFGKRYRVVMRNDRTSRRRSFHPVHRGAPGNLLGRRFTVIHGNGRRSEVADNWSETWDTTGWTGYTLFLQRLPEEPQQPTTSSQSSTQPAATTQLDEDAEADGSFELVEDDDPGDQGAGPQLRAASLLSSAAGAMGSSVTSASTRLVADEEEMGLDLLEFPEGSMDMPKRVNDQLEDSTWSGKGKGSGSASAFPKMSPEGKGYPKVGTMSSKSKKMSSTTKGTSMGHVAGGLECVDGERVAFLTSLRPGSNIDGQHPPALRFFAVMSDGGGSRDDRGRREDRDDRRDRGDQVKWMKGVRANRRQRG